MQNPPQINFHGLPPSDAVAAAIHERIGHLETLCSRIIDCRVTVEFAHRRHRRGNIFKVNAAVNVPGEHLEVSREPAENEAHKDVYVTIRDAFDALQRQLQDYTRRRRLDVKNHQNPLASGRISRLMYADGFGFIETSEGREVYFHENALLDGTLEDLDPGMTVRFHEEAGEDGPQASTVRVRRKGLPSNLPTSQRD